jgi:hypothetical protein
MLSIEWPELLIFVCVVAAAIGFFEYRRRLRRKS